MLAEIGIMIGAYIFTRMLSLLTRGGDRSEGGAVKLFAVVTLLVAALVTADLVIRGTQPSQLPRFP